MEHREAGSIRPPAQVVRSSSRGGPGDMMRVCLRNLFLYCPTWLALVLSSPAKATAATHFLPKVDYATAGTTAFVVIEDVTDDGVPDLVATHESGDSLTVYPGLGDGTFGSKIMTYKPGNQGRPVMGLFNSDSWPDIALSISGGGRVEIGLGDGLGSFTGFAQYPVGSGISGGIATGLLNADAYLDLVVTCNEDPGLVYVLLGNGDGTFQPFTAYPTLRGPLDVAVADVNNDTAVDIIVASTWCCPDQGFVSYLPGFGDGTFGPKIDIPVCSAPAYLAVGDINGDTNIDIVTACAAETIHVMTGGGNGTFTSHPELTSGFGSPAVALGDFDGDNKMDIAATLIAFSDQDSVLVYRSNGDGTFESPVRYDVGEYPWGVAAGDLNADNQIDLVTANYVNFFPGTPGSLSVLLNCFPCGTTAISVALQDARAEVGRVLLRWNVPNARDVCSVQRRTAGSDWADIGLAGFESPGVVAYEDHSVNPGERYAYRLFVQSANDQGYSSEVWVLVPTETGAPLAFRLDPSYPNPFQTQTTLNFGIPAEAPVKLGIYGVTGRRVATVIDRNLPAGWRSATWDGRDTSGRPVASGTYFARLESAGRVEIRKIVVAR